MRTIDIIDLRRSRAQYHADNLTLRETAGQKSIKVFCKVFSCAGCSHARRRRIAVPWTTECRSTRPLERLFVDLSGQQSTSAGAAETLDDDCRRLVATGVAVLFEAEVRRPEGLRWFPDRNQRNRNTVYRGVPSLGQQHGYNLLIGGLRGVAHPSWHPPRVHTRPFSDA